MRRVAGPQDDDWNADSHERWNKYMNRPAPKRYELIIGKESWHYIYIPAA